MRNKKFLSTVVATALVATTMAMPVMAANEQSGSLDVDVSTKTGVLRVAVPTQMAMVIDQFEINQAGAQIASGEFDMVNHSEMDVKVDITSKATLGTGISLVGTKASATDSTTEGEAWLAVAAQTAAGSYDDLTTGTTESPVAENYWDLTDANVNVATFDATSKEAKQTFYLAKAAAQDSSSNPATEVYTYAIADADGKISGAYAQYFVLTDVTVTDDATLKTAVDANDVYVVAKGTDSESNSIPAADGAVMTKIAKGTDLTAGSITYANTNEYYTAATTTSTPAANGKYMYVAMSTDGGKAGFQYVGKLSNANEKTWTEDDIKGIKIGYNIKGVTSTVYDEVDDNCTYGLYKETPAVTGPQLTVTKAGLITATGLTSERSWSKLEITLPDNRTFDINANPVTWDDSQLENSGVISGQMESGWMDYLRTVDGDSTFTLTLSSGDPITTTVSFK